MLTFISFWRAAAIVLNDLGSSAFYVGGISEQAIGKAAPWLILGVMLFANAVRAIYVESCGMFTRGGVYRVVKEAMGGTLAKLSVSALMFDYILTAPISGVSAGQYIIGLTSQTLTYFGMPWHPAKETVNLLAAGIAILIVIYFWRRNTYGLRESSNDALRIMYVTTIMVVLMIGWSAVTIALNPETHRLPPPPAPSNLAYNNDALGWMPKLAPKAFEKLPEDSWRVSSENGEKEPVFGISPRAGMFIGLIGIFIAFGHSLLAMSGEESLAQVNREIEFPKHRNLIKTAIVICIYSLLFTSLASFIAYAVIPDSVRPQYYDNMISGIAMHMVGPQSLKLMFQGFIVIVGFLMLSGAVNTAIIGSNGVLNRVSEDGVLSDWFRKPHARFGTTYRLINLIVILQLATIIFSRGNVYLLGEAYAFGVVWSFAFKALAVLVLRFKDKSEREWKVPINVWLGNHELPIGVGATAALLFTIAGINLITKEVATVSGIAFTLIFFILFVASERLTKHNTDDAELDELNLEGHETISQENVHVRAGGILVSIRDHGNLHHLHKVLQMIDTAKQDIIIVTVRVFQGPTGFQDMPVDQLFTSYEKNLFSRVIKIAEKEGKHVHLVVVPSSDPFQGIARVAMNLNCSEIAFGASGKMTPDRQSFLLGKAWEQLPEKPDHPIILHVFNNTKHVFYIGEHTPEILHHDVRSIHQIWLTVADLPDMERLHHQDIIHIALERLKADLHGERHDEVIGDIAAEVANP